MKFLLIILSLIPFVAISESIEWLKFLDLPQYDSITRVCQLNSATVNDFITNQSNGLVLIVKQLGSGTAQQSSCGNDFAETSAQLLSNRNITVCELSLIGETDSLFGNEGDVVVYFNGKQYKYYGRRQSTALLSFVLKLSSSHVKVITGKLDKVAYDLIPGPKLVALFMPQTPDLIAYETMAMKYSPSIPFYVALDRMVAKHLKLTLVGQIHLVKPLEKVAIPCPVNPATAQDIETFIESNKGVVMKYLNEHNLYDPQLQNPNKTTLIAIGEKSSAIGGYFYHIMTRTVRNITRQNIVTKSAATLATTATAVDPTVPVIPLPPLVPLEDIEILWIDPQVFPNMYVMMDQIERQYGFPAGLPVYLGAINMKSNQTVWFDSTLINTTADKNADEVNTLLLKDWIISVINSQIMNPLNEPIVQRTNSLKVQSFLKQPKSVSVLENENFVLECEVSDQVGDCLWLKDGQNIGFNLARLSPHYKWRGNNANGDCSIIVTSSVPERDSGEWICEVTGDQNNPTITSSPAVVSVQSLSKVEL